MEGTGVSNNKLTEEEVKVFLGGAWNSVPRIQNPAGEPATSAGHLTGNQQINLYSAVIYYYNRRNAN